MERKQEIKLRMEEPVQEQRPDRNQEKSENIDSGDRVSESDRNRDPFTGNVSSPHVQAGSFPRRGGTPFLNKAAIVAGVILMASLCLRFWAFSQDRQMTGPSHVAYNSGRVGVHMNDMIYLLDADGMLLSEFGLDALGLEGPLEDLEILADGSLLIGDYASGKIWHCSAETLACRSTGPDGPISIAANFKFVADEERGLVFIGDTNNHRLLVQDLDGKNPRLVRGSLSYPNDMFVQHDGRLLLADTFHYKILTLDYRDDMITEAGEPILFSDFNLRSMADLFRQQPGNEEEMKRQIETLSDEMRDFKLNRPMAMVRDHNGMLWVASGSEAFMFGAEVRLYDRKGEFVSRFGQDISACPEDIIRKKDKILVADTKMYKVFEVDPETYIFNEFGQDRFREILAEEMGWKRMYGFLTRWSFRFMFLAAGLLLVIYFLSRKKG